MSIPNISKCYLSWLRNLITVCILVAVLPSAFAQPNASWEQFPLIMINVTAADVPEVADLVDVVSYYSTFAPREAFLVSQSEADSQSFRFDLQVQPMINAAEAADLHFMITPALLAHPYALEDPDPLYRGDGVVHDGVLYVNPAAVPGCDDISDARCIRVPTRYDDITPRYLDYWAGKLSNFFQTVTAADPNDRVWGIYGSEEIRPWDEREYFAQRLLREAIDADPVLAGRPLMAYSPHNRMPEHLAATLLAVPGVSGAVGSHTITSAPASPRSFLPEWNLDDCDAIEPGCSVLGFEDYFPLPQEFALDASGELVPMQNHLMRGSYLGLLLGSEGHTNRIASIHRMEVQHEALDHVRNAYFLNNETGPAHLAFHLPDMNLCSLDAAQTSAAEARHDFWSGLHRGQGLFIYNYQFVVMAENGGFPPNFCLPFQVPSVEQVLTVWNEYSDGLRLIKGTLRHFMLNGVRTYPVTFTDVDADVSETIAGTDYLIDHPITGANATFAMPDYPALHGSSYQIGNTAFLVVTGSYDQRINFTVPFDSPICAVDVAHGNDTWMSFADQELHDTLAGIDGRVYRITLADDAGCP